jgi:hypothetical protein
MDVNKSGCVGTWDRVARFLLALVLLGFAIFCPFAQALGSLVVWGSGIIGTVLLVTAAMARCPLYRVLGIHT